MSGTGLQIGATDAPDRGPWGFYCLSCSIRWPDRCTMRNRSPARGGGVGQRSPPPARCIFSRRVPDRSLLMRVGCIRVAGQAGRAYQRRRPADRSPLVDHGGPPAGTRRDAADAHRQPTLGWKVRKHASSDLGEGAQSPKKGRHPVRDSADRVSLWPISPLDEAEKNSTRYQSPMQDLGHYNWCRVAPNAGPG